MKLMSFYPKYHIHPESGWMNDPNGMIYFKGKYHVFFQHCPGKTECDFIMHWGHFVSNDLIYWKRLENSLEPSCEYDRFGCWSGCAAIYDDKLFLFYTGISSSDFKTQNQCAAYSEDGITFRKYEGNPIIPASAIEKSVEFRDPCCFKSHSREYMVFGTEKDGKGAVVLFERRNTFDWTFKGYIHCDIESRGGVWECPQMFYLDDKWVMLISPLKEPGYKAFYMLGDFDGRSFTEESSGILDYGQDFYAPQTMLAPDGRRIMIAWQGSWKSSGNTAKEGWAGMMTLPRELSIRNNKLLCKPAVELSGLRKRLCDAGNPGLSEACFEIAATFDDKSFITGHSEINISDDHHIFMKINITTNEVCLYDSFTHNETRLAINKLKKLQILYDISSVEIYLNDGEYTMTQRIYPEIGKECRLKIKSDALDKFTVWEL